MEDGDPMPTAMLIAVEPGNNAILRASLCVYSDWAGADRRRIKREVRKAILAAKRKGKGGRKC